MNKQIAIIAVALALTLAVAVIATMTTSTVYALNAKNARDFGVAHGPTDNPGIPTARQSFNNQQLQ
jgi:hypothetical protein